MLGWWWAAWLASSIVPVVGALGPLVSAMSDMVRQIDENEVVTQFDFTAAAHALAPWILVAGVLQAVAAALAILVVRRIDAAQRAFGPLTLSMVPVPARPDALM